MNDPLPELTDLDRSIYEWQMWMPGVGEEGQRRLKGATVLISRVGGLGSVVAMELAAAGVGHLVLVHAGNLKPADLNRQLLQTRDHIGKPRIDSIVSRLKDLNPDVRITPVAENMSVVNAENLIKGVDLVVDAAPLFEERLAMNDAAFRQGKPLVECAMHGMAASLTTFQPGRTGCLRCQVPEVPPVTAWKRQFPVFGAVSGTVACLGAMEAIKWITGLGTLLTGEMLSMDLGSMRFRKLKLPRNPDCPTCSGVARIPHS
ncbi:MAG: HesA/MoeB/ThiF family protein [Verrucomicrobiales bacterium]|nr:HesA/MoeB/ThiF family protein [Verrucomicrobiales bacterium]